MILSQKLEKKTFDIANHYTFDDQVDVLIEEMSELTKALLKNRRAKKGYTQATIKETIQNIKEEIADVEIMLQQVVYLSDSEDEVLNIIDEKTSRQLKRIAKEQ
ncbi:hypothetical protein [Intestinibacter sp.]|uniref:hypothetical protein n=1 Tax=Intestinibacter sp. TaxID=1965304 RepID=UPI002A75B6DB|nr:hypothetical protein [Intestinibacter sp.]MDY2736604.1 hypothetical protein [Intestinibacter sp.]